MHDAPTLRGWGWRFMRFTLPVGAKKVGSILISSLNVELPRVVVDLSFGQEFGVLILHAQIRRPPRVCSSRCRPAKNLPMSRISTTGTTVFRFHLSIASGPCHTAYRYAHITQGADGSRLYIALCGTDLAGFGNYNRPTCGTLFWPTLSSW
jgi:hypothetical protein